MTFDRRIDAAIDRIIAPRVNPGPLIIAARLAVALATLAIIYAVAWLTASLIGGIA